MQNKSNKYENKKQHLNPSPKSSLYKELLFTFPQKKTFHPSPYMEVQESVNNILISPHGKFMYIHDDIYDGAKLRRGVQTLHEKHGLDHAIIGGDFLFVMGFGIGGRYDEQIVRIMADTCAAIAAGELKQLEHIVLSQQENFRQLLNDFFSNLSLSPVTLLQYRDCLSFCTTDISAQVSDTDLFQLFFMTNISIKIISRMIV